MLERVGKSRGRLEGLALIITAKIWRVLKIWLKQKAEKIAKGPKSLQQSKETHSEKRNGNVSR